MQEIAAEWIESKLKCDSTVDVDGIYVVACDSVHHAMNLAKLMGGIQFVPIDDELKSHPEAAKTPKDGIDLTGGHPVIIKTEPGTEPATKYATGAERTSVATLQAMDATARKRFGLSPT